MLDVDLLDPEESGKPCPCDSEDCRSLPKVNDIMPEFRFAVIVTTGPMSEGDILDATDALGDEGCTDASIRGHAEGMELLFDRKATSLQKAISTAIAQIESAGFRVTRVELEREAIPQ
jgi:hypothetical protein